MAEVELNRSATESGTLPGFCLCCGTPGALQEVLRKLHQQQVEEAKKRLEQRQKAFQAMQEEVFKRHEEMRKRAFDGMSFGADPNAQPPGPDKKGAKADQTPL